MSEQSDSVAFFQAKAAELRNFADSCASDELRRNALNLADQWAQLAGEMERVGGFGKKDAED
jgi:hypothetical protein